MTVEQGASPEVGARPLVSIVIPALDEADNVDALLDAYRGFRKARPEYDFELVLVDDGSTDGTADTLLAGAFQEDRVTVVELSRSFGSHYAISAGLARCEGECAVVFGADLQEPPSLLDRFLVDWEAGSDVVWGVRRTRAGRSRSGELASRTFSRLFSRYANLGDYPPEGPSGMLVDRRVIDVIGKMPERNRNVLALVAWLGFPHSRVEFDQMERRHGESRWTRRKMAKLAVDSLIQFSAMPLRLSVLSGMVLAVVGLLYAAFLLVRTLVGVPTPAGWATVLVVVLVLGGAQLLVFGIVGEYLWRAVEETRGRPLYVVRDVRSLSQSDEMHPHRPRAGRRAGLGSPAERTVTAAGFPADAGGLSTTSRRPAGE